MTGQELRDARERLGWTQKQAAGMLRVSQPYLSLLENGLRRLPPALINRLAAHTQVPATALPLKEPTPIDLLAFAASLGTLGYPGFSYLSSADARENPATLLLAAVKQDLFEPRLTEALPWLLLNYPNLEWEWLVDRVRRDNLQNRLGFLVAIARQLADKKGSREPSRTLAHWERHLEEARLAKLDVLSRRLTSAERQYFEVHRSPTAAHWNLLTALNADALEYSE